MSTKKMINNVDTTVDEMLIGTAMANSGIVKIENHRVVLRSDLSSTLPGRVAVVCGGGSGHEPAFAGYVGDGMLDASIAGSVFASPPASEILAAILALAEHNPSGILVVVFNYTGDRVNFGLAVERAKALVQTPIEIVTVGEDTALQSIDRTAGRRGLAGGVLFLKLAGAMAKSGKSLNDIVKISHDHILPNLGTIGVCLRPCIVPGNAAASFSLGDNEMEVGLGVHGEAGVLRTHLKSAKETVKIMLEHMTNPSSATHLALTAGDRVCLLLNNLGAISDLEMGILVKDSAEELTSKYGVQVERIMAGRIMTSLEMSGFSITVLRLVSDSILEFVDLEARPPGWSGNAFVRKVQLPVVTFPDPLLMEKYIQHRRLGPEVGQPSRDVIQRALQLVCENLITNENILNEMDTGSGDADCGSTLCRGAKKLLSVLADTGNELSAHPATLLRKIGQVSEAEMGGSSGGMFSIFFEATATKLEVAESVSLSSITHALFSGLEAIKRHGRAQVGDRTLIDALQPALEHLQKSGGEPQLSVVLKGAAEAAAAGAASTQNMKAHAGRASYVPVSELKMPDPGAHAVAIILDSVAKAFAA